MEINNLRIDEDLESYLSSKDDVNSFINECIREAKKYDYAFKQDEQAQTQPPVEDSSVSPLVYKEQSSNSKLGRYALILFASVALLLICLQTCDNGSKPVPPVDNSSSEIVVADTTDASSVAASSVAEESKKPIVWSFSTEKDKMTSTKNIWAKIYSNNSVSLDFPYEDTGATITIRYMKKYGYDAMVSIGSGQIYGSEYENDNYVMVRFDEGKPIKYWFDEPSDGSSEMIFIRKTKDFIARCKKAKDIKVEVPLYQAGRPIFEFHVDEPLKWEY